MKTYDSAAVLLAVQHDPNADLIRTVQDACIGMLRGSVTHLASEDGDDQDDLTLDTVLDTVRFDGFSAYVEVGYYRGKPAVAMYREGCNDLVHQMELTPVT